MDRFKYLAKNTFIFALGNLGTKLINFFLVPLYTNVLTTEEYGTIDLIFTICTFAVPIIIMNIYEAVMRYCLDEDADYNKVMSVGILMILISTFGALVLALLSKKYEPTSKYYIYIYFYAISSGMAQLFLCYLRGKEKLVQYSFGNIIQSLFIALFNIVFILILRYGIKGYLLAYIFANIITVAYSFIAGNVSEILHNFKIERELAYSMIKYSVILIPNSFMWWIMNSADRLMLTSIIGVASTGIYAISNKIPSIISVVSTIFNQAFSYSAIKEENSRDKDRFSNIIYDNLCFVVLNFGMILIMFIKEFVKVYVNHNFYEAWIYTPPLIWGTSILVLATFLSTSYTVHKDSKGFLFSATIGAIINICLNLIFIPLSGIMGAAVSTAFSYFVVLVYRFLDTKKYIKIDVFSVKHILGILFITISCFAIYLDNIISKCIILLLLIFNCIINKDILKNSHLFLKMILSRGEKNNDRFK